MTRDVTHGRITSVLGEHLIALLIVATVVVAVLTAYPALAAEARGTASKAQERVNTPLVLASYLDDESAPKSP